MATAMVAAISVPKSASLPVPPPRVRPPPALPQWLTAVADDRSDAVPGVSSAAYDDTIPPKAAAPPPPAQPLHSSTCELKFKDADGTWVTYTLRPGSPVYFGRERVRALIEANYPHATYVSPTDAKQQSVLASRQAHGVAQWLEAGEGRAPEAGFYLRIIAKRNGDAPTNPLWVLDRSGSKQTWKKTTFRAGELFRLDARSRFCIGGSFHLKVGHVHKLSAATLEALGGAAHLPIGDPPTNE